MKRKTLIRAIVIATVLGLITGAIIGYLMWNKKHKDLSTEKPDFVLTADALMSEFEENEANANQKYLGKIIEVTGTVSEITADTTTTIALESTSMMSEVLCEMAPGLKANGLQPGKKATLRGTCSGMLMDVVLSRCVIVEDKN